MKRETGLTLIELIVTILISSILFLVLGSILVSANTWWVKSGIKARSESNMRYAKRRMEFLLRNASTEASVNGGAFKIAGNKILFNRETPGRDEIWLNEGSIKYKNNHAAGNPPETLLQDVQRLEFVLLTAAGGANSANDSAKNSVLITIVTSTTTSSGHVIKSSSTFVVKSRNSGL